MCSAPAVSQHAPFVRKERATSGHQVAWVKVLLVPATLGGGSVLTWARSHASPLPLLPRRRGHPGHRTGSEGSLALTTFPLHHVLVIRVASFPQDLGAWDQDEQPYYLEVFGEAEPVLDMAHAEVIPAGGDVAGTTTTTPIYEYWWTIGHGGTKPQHRHLFEDRKKLDLWHRLEDVAARVYMYFPISGGWRAQELVASAKYLSPVAKQSDWTAKAAADWQRMQPILAGAGHAAGALGTVPGVGAVAAGVSPILSAMSKLQVGSVPQGVKGFDWYVEKVTVPASARHGVMQGIVWAIPKKMFELLGGRLTGSLALSFVPTWPAEDKSTWRARPLPMLAHAVVYADGQKSWVPAQNRFVELELSPKAPSSVQTHREAPTT